ncbi:MAG: hypothetical protein JWP31_1808 [Aeromicrobium sp.]|nr:hypothetical protein [Aeromicrobium sp.]
MPISPLVLQRRQAELGRIRLGQKQATSNGKSRPSKLDRFRFTSVSEQYVRDLAALYGGTAQPWDNNGIPSWEVITTATSIPVIVVKNGLSQWMETWSGGGCTHRCDGEFNTLTNEACDPNDPAHVAAKPTTRLSVMLPELEAIGVFRLETHGWNAAAEIPAVAELAQFVGDLVPAVLHLVERRAIKDGKTSRFVVPVLDLQIGAAKLREIVESKSGVAALDAPASSGAPAIEGPRSQYFDLLSSAASPEEVNAVWHQAKADGALDQPLADAIAAAAARVKAKPVQQLEESIETVEGEPDLDPPDVIWQRCITEAGKLGWDIDMVENALKQKESVAVFDATAEQLDAFLTYLEQEAA